MWIFALFDFVLSLDKSSDDFWDFVLPSGDLWNSMEGVLFISFKFFPFPHNVDDYLFQTQVT